MDFINASMDFLHNLGAIDKNENLLSLGFVLAELPVDSVVGKMLIMGVVSFKTMLHTRCINYFPRYLISWTQLLLSQLV